MEDELGEGRYRAVMVGDVVVAVNQTVTRPGPFLVEGAKSDSPFVNDAGKTVKQAGETDGVDDCTRAAR